MCFSSNIIAFTYSNDEKHYCYLSKTDLMTLWHPVRCGLKGAILHPLPQPCYVLIFVSSVLALKFRILISWMEELVQLKINLSINPKPTKPNQQQQNMLVISLHKPYLPEKKRKGWKCADEGARKAETVCFSIRPDSHWLKTKAKVLFWSSDAVFIQDTLQLLLHLKYRLDKDSTHHSLKLHFPFVLQQLWTLLVEVFS